MFSRLWEDAKPVAESIYFDRKQLKKSTSNDTPHPRETGELSTVRVQGATSVG